MGRCWRCFGSRAGCAVRPDEEATRAARVGRQQIQQGMHFNGSPKNERHLESSVELLRDL